MLIHPYKEKLYLVRQLVIRQRFFSICSHEVFSQITLRFSLTGLKSWFIPPPSFDFLSDLWSIDSSMERLTMPESSVDILPLYPAVASFLITFYLRDSPCILPPGSADFILMSDILLDSLSFDGLVINSFCSMCFAAACWLRASKV